MNLILCGLLGHRMRKAGSSSWKRCTRCGRWQGMADILNVPPPVPGSHAACAPPADYDG